MASETSNYMFDWPVDEARLTRGFLSKAKGFQKRPHLGLDLAASRGTSIYAAHDGVVIYVGQEFNGYGRIIMIEGPGGWASFYAHLSAAKIKEGDRVQKGKIIGLMGRTGRATGTHLHFELRKNRHPVNPMLYLPHSRVASR